MYAESTEQEVRVRKYDVARLHPRHFLSVPVTVQRFLAPGIQRSHGPTLELSQGGTSAVLRGPLDAGEMVRLKLQFPDISITTLAAVRYSNAYCTGFEFLLREPQLEHKIEDCVRGLLLFRSDNAMKEPFGSAVDRYGRTRFASVSDGNK